MDAKQHHRARAGALHMKRQAALCDALNVVEKIAREYAKEGINAIVPLELHLQDGYAKLVRETGVVRNHPVAGRNAA